MTLQVNKRKVFTFVVAVLFLATIGAVIYLSLQLSQTNKYLYEVRDDYYGNSEYGKERITQTDNASLLQVPEDFNEEDPANNYSPEFTIISQEVKTLRVSSGYDYEKDQENFKDSSIRVVKVKLTNDTDFIYNYYEGDVGYTDPSGRIIRSISVAKESNQNLTNNQDYFSLELAPGGEVEMYIYFTDTGVEIEELQTYNNFQV